MDQFHQIHRSQGLKTKIKTSGVTSGPVGRLRRNHAKSPRFFERGTEPLCHRLKYARFCDLGLSESPM